MEDQGCRYSQRGSRSERLMRREEKENEMNWWDRGVLIYRNSKGCLPFGG